MEESTTSNSQALMNLETSARKSLKERELLQVEIVRLNIEKLVNGLAMQLQKDLSTMQNSIESLQKENEQLRNELQKERENSKSFREKTYEAVNSDRKRLQKLESKTKTLESQSLWDQIKKIWS